MYAFFDLDGTLTDPQEGITACIRYALGELGVAAPTEAALRAWIGPPLQESFTTLLGTQALAAQAVQLYRDRFARQGMFENRVYAGIPDALAAIASQVEALFVVTSKPQIFAETIVQHFDLAPFFRRVYGSQLDGKLADKGDLIAYVLRQEGIAPAEGVMVGDRCHDILGAHSNHVPAIGVLWGYGSLEELKAAAPNHLCKSPAHLPHQVVKALI